MRYRVFGARTGMRVSEYALGTGMLGKAYGYGTSVEDAESIVAGYAEAGGNLIDLSDAYQGGESERLVGRLIGDRRNDFVLLSKYSRGARSVGAIADLGNNRKTMVQAVEASLKRLQTDRIDVYLAHADDRVTPIEEIVRGLDDLARAGKIGYGGLSNFPAWRVATAATIADLRGWLPVAAIEVEYSLLERTTERELLPMAGALGLAVLGYSPLAAGLLTAKYRRGETGRATAFEAGVAHAGRDHDAVLDVLIEIAGEVDAAPAAVAIAWVAARGVLPILGANTRAQLDANLAASAVRLSADQVERLDRVSAVPEGYPHELLKSEGVGAMMTGGRSHLVDRPAGVVR